MKKQIVKLTGVIMMLVFLAGIAPKEYLHDLFFDHHDTVEPVLSGKDVVIGERHAHCTFLSFEFAPFLASEPHVLVFEELPEHHISYLLSHYQFHHQARSAVLCLRGPPMVALS